MQARRRGSPARHGRRASWAAGVLALAVGLSACADAPAPLPPRSGDTTGSPSTEAALVAPAGGGTPATSPDSTETTEATTAEPDPGLSGRVHAEAARLRRDRPAEQVLTSTATVVAGTAPVARLREAAAAGDVAWQRCRAIWPAAEEVPPLVVLLPSTPTTTSRTTPLPGPGGAGDPASGDPAQERSPADVTAVATTVVVGEPPSAQARVHLDPRGWASLTEEGRRVVLTHECVHVALSTRERPPAPAWLVEGVAEYVAYRDAAVRRDEVLAPLFARVARDGAPPSFPTAADFEVGHGDVSALLNAYAEASSAAAVYADLYGETALLKLVTTGPGASGAPGHGSFAELEAAFLPQWRHELQQAAARSAQP